MERQQIINRLESTGFGNEISTAGIADLLLDMKQEDFHNMQSNYSAMMYIISEQQALIGTLLQELLKTGALSEGALEKITDVYGKDDVLGPMYSDLYKRFAWYFIRVSEALADKAKQQPDAWVPGEKVK
jgi:hypothetical protein